jgi:hypothetical protein
MAPATLGNVSQVGWPPRTGMVLMNSADESRPLDGRPGHDPFDGTDPSYSCHGEENAYPSCIPGGPSFAPPAWLCGTDQASGRCPADRAPGNLVPANIGHNELLGGHGDDIIYAGPNGDVIWGDYKPCCQPTTQVDHLYGGPGNDFIYASHGTDYIYSGGGNDVVHAHFGHGEIHCQSATVRVFLTHKSRHLYKLFGPCRVSYAHTLD